MSIDLGKQHELEELVLRSKRRANRSFWIVIVAVPLTLLALVNSLPGWINSLLAYQSGREGSISEEEQTQRDMWLRNVQCSAREFDGIRTDYNLKVGATVCPSGDTLIRVERPDGSLVFRWVPVDSIVHPETEKPDR